MPVRVRQLAKRILYSPPVNWPAARFVRRVSPLLPLSGETLNRYFPPTGVITSRLPNRRTLSMWSERGKQDDRVARVVFWEGWAGYQPETTRLFFDLARHSPCTLDIGSHVGFYALLAAHANPAGTVYAFEPLPRAFARLTKNVALNRLTNVRCEPAAVSDSNGKHEFFHVTDDRGLPSSSSLSESFMHTVVPERHLTSTSVAVRRLDDYAREHALPRVGLVKIDTESTEPAVLAGMAGILERDHPDIICEVLPGQGVEPRLQSILEPLGYRYYQLGGSGPRPRQTITASTTEARDYLFSVRDLGHPR